VTKPSTMHRRLAAAAVVVAAAVIGSMPPNAARAADEPRHWDLTELYPTQQDWDRAFAAERERVQALGRLRSGATRDAAALRQALVAISDAQREVARLWVYASLSGDEDLRQSRPQERGQQVRALWSMLGEQTAWLAPAIQQAGDERVRGWIAADPVLQARFSHFLDDTLRLKPHTLSPHEEALLAAVGPALAQPERVFSQLVDAELPRSTVMLSDGRKLRLDVTGYESARQAPSRDDRKRVFEGFFGSLEAAQGTLGANLTGKVLADVFRARARHYASSLDAALAADNMPGAVYRQLVEQAHAGLPTLHRYLELRRAMLGITDELAYYDNYPPLVSAPDAKFDYGRSQQITLAALAPLGEQYLSLLKQGFGSNWVDSHPREGKASGGYMAGAAYDVHPYLLLNHSDDYESLSTFAHEWGHAVHTLLTRAHQPFDKADYSTFIAESASIGNEMLLVDYLVAHASTAAEKRYYLAQALESIRTTFFRQAMFAEFELAIHEEAEAGRPLGGARLSELYCGIARHYYGEAEGVMKIDPRYCIEWAYISHFFRDFYVWQYATSMAGAAEFSRAIRREGAPARERFIRLLEAGGSDYAYPLYLKAGVDLARPEPYQALIARMNRLIDEFEQLGPVPPSGR
jgi:oligoendopeptidase F